jgi:hypothetical protein
VSKQRKKQKLAEHKKMIEEANKRHDKEFGSNPVVLNYAKHIKGRSDISQKR